MLFYICMHIYTYIYMYTHIYMRLCEICSGGCTKGSGRIGGAAICMYINIHILIHTCIYIYAHTPTYIRWWNMQWRQNEGQQEHRRVGNIEVHTISYSHAYINIHMRTHLHILGGGICSENRTKSNGSRGGAAILKCIRIHTLIQTSNIYMRIHIYILGGGICSGGSTKGNGRTGGAARGYSGGHRRFSSHSSRETYSQYFCWMARYVVCGVWCGVCSVVCGVWCVVCGVWCVVWSVVCGVWCVVWGVLCGVWCVVCGV